MRALDVRRDTGETTLAFTMKLFYTGPFLNAELLLHMLESHGIIGSHEFEDTNLPDDGDLERRTRVLVKESDYARAHELFYTEREDEL